MRYFVSLASGDGKRLFPLLKVKKQYAVLNEGTSYAEVSFILPLKTAISSSLFERIIVVINKEDEGLTRRYLSNAGLNQVELVYGSNFREASLKNAAAYLKKIKADENDVVYVHDSARVLLSIEFLLSLAKEDSSNLIPCLDLSDSILDKRSLSYLDRDNFKLVQTPQVMRFKDLISIMNLDVSKYTDEGSMLKEANIPFKLIKGDRNNIKLTDQESLHYIEYLRSKANEYGKTKI